MISKRKFFAFFLNRFNKRALLLVIDAVFLLTHLFYLFFFLLNDITEMFVFNIFSVSFYALLEFFIYKKPDPITRYASLAIVEVTLHAGAATIFMGWEAGFILFIVCCGPFPFFLPFKRKAVPFVLDVLFALEFILLRVYTVNKGGVVYTDISSRTVTGIFIFNTFMSFLLIAFFSSVNNYLKRIERQKMKDKNEELSMLIKIDPLSQLFNRRAMVDFLKRMDSSAKERGEWYVIGMGDLDNFKHVNDTYGHASGDMVITTVSKIMTEAVPSEGYVCRWGGEELLFAVPGADTEQGRQIAERIRNQLKRYVFTTEEGEQFSVTITLGVCACRGAFSYERCVSIADQFLYYGKEQGRNRVITENEFPLESLK